MSVQGWVQYPTFCYGNHFRHSCGSSGQNILESLERFTDVPYGHFGDRHSEQPPY